MKQIVFVIALATTLTACSKQEDKAAAENQEAATPAVQTAPAANPHAGTPGMNMSDAAAPAGHAGMANMGAAPAGAAAAAAGTGQAPAAAAAAANKPYQGKVKSVAHAAGYSYIEVDNKGKTLWIACMPTDVKAGDTVAWGDGAVMHNFESKTLHRTFDEIVFVNEVAKVK